MKVEDKIFYLLAYSLTFFGVMAAFAQTTQERITLGLTVLVILVLLIIFVFLWRDDILVVSSGGDGK